MSVNKIVKNNVKVNVNIPVAGWNEALKDAESELSKAQKSVASWKATIRTCRKRIAENAPWPTAADAAVTPLQGNQVSKIESSNTVVKTAPCKWA